MPLVHGAHAPGGADAAGWLLVALLVLVPSIAYLGAARARRGAGRDWPRWRAASLIIGLGLVSVAVSPAMHALGEHDPRGHMIQHLLLGMFAPLALVLAAPATLLLGVLPVTCRGTVRLLLRSRVLHSLTHPATAAMLDMGGLYLLYLTPLYNFTTTNTLAHHLVNLHFLLAGYLFTWSIVGPDPAPRRPTITIRALVLVAAGAAHAYLAKLLYARAPELRGGSSHDLDQVQAAAQLMYYGGDLAELALAVALFAIWYHTPRARHHRRRPVGLRQLPRMDHHLPAAAAQLHRAAPHPVRTPGVRAPLPTPRGALPPRSPRRREALPLRGGRAAGRSRAAAGRRPDVALILLVRDPRSAATGAGIRWACGSVRRGRGWCPGRSVRS
jgi:putative membrane protein